MRETHPIEPLFSKNSHTLILGSFPSVKSRESGFFYGHSQNRFWRVIAEIFGQEPATTVSEKKRLILSNGLALWDVIKSCNIKGSSDMSITDVVPNNLDIILQGADIKRIFVNGRTAERYYIKYQLEKTGIEAVCLPSTSPANAACTYERLLKEWSIIKNEL